MPSDEGEAIGFLELLRPEEVQRQQFGGGPASPARSSFDVCSDSAVQATASPERQALVCDLLQYGVPEPKRSILRFGQELVERTPDGDISVGWHKVTRHFGQHIGLKACAEDRCVSQQAAMRGGKMVEPRHDQFFERVRQGSDGPVPVLARNELAQKERVAACTFDKGGGI